jgi:hypothetical protein
MLGERTMSPDTLEITSVFTKKAKSTEQRGPVNTSVQAVGWLINMILVFMFLFLSLSQAAEIDAKVKREIAQFGQAQVIISLIEPFDPRIDYRSRRTIISGIQRAVINDLNPLNSGSRKHFELKYRYRYVSALAAVITQGALSVLNTDPQVVAIDLDEMERVDLLESTSLIKATEVHTLIPPGFEKSITGENVVVAILDTGIDSTHSDLQDNIIDQHCFVYYGCPPQYTNESSNAQDDQGHGTHVAGIIASPLGVAQDADIMAVKVCNSKGLCWPSNSIAGLDWILTRHLEAQPVDIVNISLGGGGFDTVEACEADVPAYTAVVKQLIAQGITVFASSGNNGSAQTIKRPACFSDTIAVAATYDEDSQTPKKWAACDQAERPEQDQVTCFSNTNALVDVVAPGAMITSTYKGGGIAEMGGTSQASPMAAGVAALMLEANPNLSPRLIMEKLQCTGLLVTDAKNDLTFPRVNAMAALQAALGAGTLEFSVNHYVVNEEDGIATIEVIRTGEGYGQVTVNYVTLDQTAKANLDYKATQGTLVWAEGDVTPKQFTVDIIHDDYDEVSENLTLALSDATGGSCLNDWSFATLTIQEAAILQLAAATYTVDGSSVTLEVMRTGSSEGSVTVDYSTIEGSASAGSDYTAVEGTFKWDAGDMTSRYIVIEVLDDDIDEDEEFFEVALMNGVGNVKLESPTHATITILDNDVSMPGTLQFSTQGYTFDEASGKITVEALRTAGTNGEVSVDYTIETAQDSQIISRDTLVWADNETTYKRSTTALFSSESLQDSDDSSQLLSAKQSTQFIIRLLNPTGGATLGAIDTITFALTTEEEAHEEQGETQAVYDSIKTHEDEKQLPSAANAHASGNMGVMIQLKGQGTGRILSSPYGIDCSNIPTSTCSATSPSDFLFHCLPSLTYQACTQYFERDVNSEIVLTPQAGPGAVFLGWGGHRDCEDGRLTTMKDKRCVAYFGLRTAKNK